MVLRIHVPIHFRVRVTSHGRYKFFGARRFHNPEAESPFFRCNKNNDSMTARWQAPKFFVDGSTLGSMESVHTRGDPKFWNPYLFLPCNYLAPKYPNKNRDRLDYFDALEIAVHMIQNSYYYYLYHSSPTNLERDWLCNIILCEKISKFCIPIDPDANTEMAEIFPSNIIE